MVRETLLKPVFFIHVPKTAGASVDSAIINALDLSKRRVAFLPKGGWVRVHDQPDWTKRPDVIKRARSAKFVFGHFHTDTYREMTQGLDHFAFTFLRDPEERLRSVFRYARSSMPANSYPINSTGLTFSQYLAYPDERHQWQIDNLMTRMLGGNYGDKPRTESDWNDMVATACARLDKLDFIGMTQHMSADLITLFEKLGLPAPVMVPRTNVTNQLDRESAKRDDDTVKNPLARQILDRCTRYDRLIYAHALELKFGPSLVTMDKAQKRSVIKLPKQLGR